MTTTYVAARIWDNQFALEIFPKLLDAFWLTIRLTIVEIGRAHV